MRRRIRALLTFTPADLWILGQSWILLLGVALALCVVRLVHVQQVLAWRAYSANRRHASSSGDTIRHLQRLVGVAAHYHLLPVRCLQQSLVLQRLLGRRGIETELAFGVRKDGEALLAHAWLEYGGKAANEGSMAEGHGRFWQLWRPPALPRDSCWVLPDAHTKNR